MRKKKHSDTQLFIEKNFLLESETDLLKTKKWLLFNVLKVVSKLENLISRRSNPVVINNCLFIKMLPIPFLSIRGLILMLESFVSCIQLFWQDPTELENIEGP